MSMTRCDMRVILGVGLLAICGAANAGEPYTIDWYTIDGGGGTSAGGGFAISATTGQHDAGPRSGGAYTATGGFWVAAGAQAAEQPLPENDLGLSCVVDADCPQATVCVVNECYIPKSKYISLRPSDPGEMVALRVTMTANSNFPALVGSSWWVTPATGNEPSETFRLGCEPWFQDWSTAPEVIHVGDRHITSAAVYRVEAVNIGCDISDPACYSPPLDLPTVQNLGDAVGLAMNVPNGVINLDDVFASILVFQGADSPQRELVDVDGDVPNAVINLADAFVIVQAFQSAGAYPYAGPVQCP